MGRIQGGSVFMINKLFKNKYLFALSIVIILFIIASTSFFLGWRDTLNNLSIKIVTSTEAANAMKNDNFYSSYNENVLIIHSKVAAIRNNGNNTVVQLSNNSLFQTFCETSSNVASLKIGQNITITAIGATAHRNKKAVTLIGCYIL